MNKCIECEFFGCFREFKTEETKVGLQADKNKGAYCENPDIAGSINRPGGTKTIIYEGTQSTCRGFKPKQWERPNNCFECEKMIDIIFGEDKQYTVNCSGYPFTGKVGTEPCANGKCREGTQIKLF